MNKKRRIISAIILIVGLCYLLHIGKETEEVYKENADLSIDYEFLAENYEILESNICTETYPVEENSALKEYFKEPEEPTVSENVMQLKYPSKEQYDIMIGMIKNGDFSCLDIRDSYVEDYVHISDYTEWVTCDIDKDGFDELILQDKEPVADSQEYRIKAVFTYRPNGMHCVEVDFNDGTEYCFLGESGNLIYTYDDYCGNMYGRDEYFSIDEKGELERKSGLYITYIEDENRLYYEMQVEPNWEKKSLTKEEFFTEYEKMTGVTFENSSHDFGDVIVESTGALNDYTLQGKNVVKINHFDWFDHNSTDFLKENSEGNIASIWSVDFEQNGEQELILSITYPPREVPTSQVFYCDGEDISEWFGFWGNQDTPLYSVKDKLIYDTVSNYGGSLLTTCVKTDLTTGVSYALAAYREQYDGQEIPTEWLCFPEETICTRDLLDGIYEGVPVEIITEEEYKTITEQKKEQKILLEEPSIILDYDMNKGIYPGDFSGTSNPFLTREEQNAIVTQQIYDFYEFLNKK